MLQTFESASDPSLGPPRVKSVRAAMSEAGIQALLGPRSDEFQGEYVQPGVYSYFLRVVFDDISFRTAKGTVTVLR